MRGERIETDYGVAVRGENEDGGKFALLILACLAQKVGIEFGDTAAKAGSIMIR